MNTVDRLSVFLMCVSVVAACGGAGSDGPLPITNRVQSGSVLSALPTHPDPEARYLIYLHGAIIETGGMRPTHPTFGAYEYAAILKAFGDRGFTVISEVRSAGSAPDRYALRVSAQIQRLLDAGVPEKNISVVGFSKGGLIAALASAEVLRDDVNWVVLAGCGQWVGMLPDAVPHGRVLSLLDHADDLAGSCSTLLARMPDGATHDEVILDLGTGHGAFYRPDPAWLEPVIEWAGL